MIRDLRTEIPAPGRSSDVCIVGAGAAGITMAVLLSRAGRHVTLLEAGGRHGECNANLLQATTSGLAYRGLTEGRAQALGGTTNLWGGQILPLSPMDFEVRPWVEGSGWPLTSADLQLFYQKATEVEGLREAIPCDDAVWKRLGTPRPELDGLQCYFSRWCSEPNFAVQHARTLEGESVTVWLHSRAVRLLCNDGRVEGVVARSGSGPEHTFRAKEIVFCLGAIESNRFFLQPRAQGLPWNESGLLGCHFQDHIDCDAATLLPLKPRAMNRMFDAVFLHGLKYMPKLRLAESEQRRHEVLNVGASIYAQDDENEALLVRQDAKKILHGQVRHLRTRNVVRALRNAPRMTREAWRYVAGHRGALPTHKPLMLRVHCEQEPLGSSRIRLTSETDECGMGKADVYWHISERELRTIQIFTQAAATSLASIANVIPHPDLAGQDGTFRRNCQDSFHHMGGMRMHASPRLGVVDETLRLHGTSNCYVCSSAVFPTSGFSNPTHTLLALAARLADHLTR